jgi:allantoate deiminase
MDNHSAAERDPGGGRFARSARAILARCDALARFSEEPGRLTRTFLSEPMRALHDQLAGWMRQAGLGVRLDAAGNLIGHYPGADAGAPVLLIGSHVDTVPDAGKYDGILGVLVGVAALELQGGQPFPFAVDVLAFSEEEGVRYHTPYLGSSAVAGSFDPGWLGRTDARGVTMAEALRHFGLDPDEIPRAAYRRDQLLGYLEVHIEQGPVLEARGLPVATVSAIAGQSRLWLRFEGRAGHAGTLPMDFRRDALAAAAEFVLAAERQARGQEGLRATVGTVAVAPGAVNVVPGSARLSLDVRHARDEIREGAVAHLLQEAGAIAGRRGVRFHVDQAEHHRAVPADARLTDLLELAVVGAGCRPRQLVSGAGHDAAVLAALTPMAMLFVRSPGGVSHHPDEAVRPDDIATALEVAEGFLHILAEEMA